MIIKIREWCEGIIIAVVISIIIEMIIPEGKNKKYIKVIIGIYIMFVSLSPILEFLQYDFNFDEILNYNTVEVSQNYEDVKKIYISGIESSLKSEIEELGYEVDFVEIFTDVNYENIEKIVLEISGKKDEIEQIIIGEKENKNYEDIIELISTNYSVSSGKIIFK